MLPHSSVECTAWKQFPVNRLKVSRPNPSKYNNLKSNQNIENPSKIMTKQQLAYDLLNQILSVVTNMERFDPHKILFIDFLSILTELNIVPKNYEPIHTDKILKFWRLLASNQSRTSLNKLALHLAAVFGLNINPASINNFFKAVRGNGVHVSQKIKSSGKYNTVGLYDKDVEYFYRSFGEFRANRQKLINVNIDVDQLDLIKFQINLNRIDCASNDLPGESQQCKSIENKLEQYIQIQQDHTIYFTHLGQRQAIMMGIQQQFVMFRVSLNIQSFYIKLLEACQIQIIVKKDQIQCKSPQAARLLNGTAIFDTEFEFYISKSSPEFQLLIIGAKEAKMKVLGTLKINLKQYETEVDNKLDKLVESKQKCCTIKLTFNYVLTQMVLNRSLVNGTEADHHYYIQQIGQLEQQVSAVKKQNDKLKKRNEALEAQVFNLNVDLNSQNQKCKDVQTRFQQLTLTLQTQTLNSTNLASELEKSKKLVARIIDILNEHGEVSVLELIEQLL